MSLIKYLLFVTLFFTYQQVVSQTKSFDLDQIMSKEDQKKAGISKLSYNDQKFLEKWLTNFTANLLYISESNYKYTSEHNNARFLGNRQFYNNICTSHWIKNNINNGKYIRLEDGSLWQIMDIDIIVTSIWLVATEIVVLDATNPTGDYAYVLVNLDDNEKVYAKLVNNE